MINSAVGSAQDPSKVRRMFGGVPMDVDVPVDAVRNVPVVFFADVDFTDEQIEAAGGNSIYGAESATCYGTCQNCSTRVVWE